MGLGGAIATLDRRRPGWPRFTGVTLCVLAAMQWAAFFWYPVADLVMRPLEMRARAMAANAPRNGYAAILVLGGIGHSPSVVSDGERAARSTGDRVARAARLYDSGLAPIIIASGGGAGIAPAKSSMPEAEAMRGLLLNLGVPADAIVLEPRSLSTRENALESRKLVDRRDKVALVTSAYHMPRAMREMQCAGLHAVAFPSGYLVPLVARPTAQWLRPTIGAHQMATIAIKEWLGLLVQDAERLARTRSCDGVDEGVEDATAPSSQD